MTLTALETALEILQLKNSWALSTTVYGNCHLF